MIDPVILTALGRVVAALAEPRAVGLVVDGPYAGARRVAPGIYQRLDGSTSFNVPELCDLVDLPQSEAPAVALALATALRQQGATDVVFRQTPDDPGSPEPQS